jgi:thiol-disulfide isomerase/thioredoxin
LLLQALPLKHYNIRCMKTLLSFLLSVLSVCLFSQTYSIKAHITRLPVNKIILTRIHGDDLYAVDSLVASGEYFSFSLPQNSSVGLYRIILGKTKRAEFMGGAAQSIDLIFNLENITLNSDFNFPTDSLQILQSEENKIYYSFLKKYEQLDYRIQQVYPIIMNYPKSTDFFNSAVNEFDNLQKEQGKLIEEYSLEYPGTYASRIIKVYRTPFLEGTWTEMERVLYMREHFFDGLDFDDKLLLNSNIYTKKIIDYLSLYRNPNLVQSEQEYLFIEAVDKILSSTNKDRDVYGFILNYLVKGFEKFKFEKVLTHIADNWLGENCETDNRTLLLKRVESYRKMAPGNIAPDIVLEDINGNLTALSESGHDFTLVLFWASWCPHCKSMIPELKEWYEKERDIDMEIMAISIDTSKTEWQKVITDNKLSWINCNDLSGWDGKAAIDYNIYATPTMFILDRNRKILAKPVTFYEFLYDVEKIK